VFRDEKKVKSTIYGKGKLMGGMREKSGGNARPTDQLTFVFSKKK